MPVLKNPRHEYFAQGIAKGLSQTQAYIEAGYNSKTGAEVSASRLIRKANIKARANELRERGAIRAEITIADLVQELEEARQAAAAAETVQSSGMVSATMGKAKLLGLLVDKLSGPDGGPVAIQTIKLVAPMTNDDS
jgi:phage terminase small subunit